MDEADLDVPAPAAEALLPTRQAPASSAKQPRAVRASRPELTYGTVIRRLDRRRWIAWRSFPVPVETVEVVMSVPTLHAITQRIASMDRIELEELAFECIKTHAAMCRFAAREDERETPHADDTTILQRIGSTSSTVLAEMLAPAALLGVSAHELWAHD